MDFRLNRKHSIPRIAQLLHWVFLAIVPFLIIGGCSSDGGDEESFILYTPSLSTDTYLLDGSYNVVYLWPRDLFAGQSAFLQEDGSIIRAGSINDAVHDPKWIAKDCHFIMCDNNVADSTRGLDGGNSMVVEIEPPILPDGGYELGADGIYGPAEPILGADLGVEACSVGTAQRLSDGRTLSCDCPNSLAIWLSADGTVISTEDLFEDSMVDADNAQVYRLVSYPKDYEGVRAVPEKRT